MTARLLPIFLTGAYLVILYFFGIPIVQAPHQWKNLLIVAFCLCNVVAFWTSVPRPFRIALGGLNVVIGGTVLVGVVLTLILGSSFSPDKGDVAPLLLYFLTFVPIVAGIYLFKLRPAGVGHGL